MELDSILSLNKRKPASRIGVTPMAPYGTAGFFNENKDKNENMTQEELKKIREHIEREVTHIAREHQTTDMVVWKQMLLAAAEHIGAKKLQSL